MKFKEGDYISLIRAKGGVRRVKNILQGKGFNEYILFDPKLPDLPSWTVTQNFVEEAYKLIGSSEEDYKLYSLQRELNNGV